MTRCGGTVIVLATLAVCGCTFDTGHVVLSFPIPQRGAIKRELFQGFPLVDVSGGFEQIAYVCQVDEGESLVVNGESIARGDAIEYPLLNPEDLRRVAFVVRGSSGYHAYLGNRRVAGPFESVDDLFFASGGKLCVIGRRGGQAVLFVGEGEAASGSYIRAIPSGSGRLVAQVEREGVFRVLTDEGEGPGFHGASPPVLAGLADTPVFVARETQGEFVVIGDRVGPAGDSVHSLSVRELRGKPRVVYVLVGRNSEVLYIDGSATWAHQKFTVVAPSLDGKDVAYVAAVEDGREHLFVNGVRQAAYEKITEVVWGTGRTLGYICKEGRTWSVFVEGRIVHRGDRATNLSLASQGVHPWSVVVHRGQSCRLALAESQDGWYDAIGWVQISPDGRTWAYMATRDRSVFLIIGSRTFHLGEWAPWFSESKGVFLSYWSARLIQMIGTGGPVYLSVPKPQINWGDRTVRFLKLDGGSLEVVEAHF